jgi:pimeloyl-ACP methyl ester carboxylesterase
MRRLLITLVVVLLIGGSGLVGEAPHAEVVSAQPAPPVPGACKDGPLPGGALYRICVPERGWNNRLIVFAHGYVEPGEPLQFASIGEPGTPTYLPTVAQSFGFAFATTTYRQNGLAVLEGVEDIRELAAAFPGVAGVAPQRTYLMGFSEGGLVAALLAERSPGLFSGALSACGPIGDFQKQIDYFGDFRTLFDYFYPNVLPTSPISIPQKLQDDWEKIYAPQVDDVITSNPVSATQLISTSLAAVEQPTPTAIVSSAVNILWYNVFATNDIRQKVGGNPYENQDRRYSGSRDDTALNVGVQRFDADPAARAQLQCYQTSGVLPIPMIVLHTTGDEIIPFAQAELYREKVRPIGRGSLMVIPVNRYGHCNFQPFEILGALNQLEARVDASLRVYLPVLTRPL